MNSSFRSIVTAILLFALFLPPSVLSGNSDPHQTVRTTAYTHSEADHIQYGRKTALGTQLKDTRSYTSAAADWSRYPVGTTFKIKGSSTTYVIDDYGSALVGTGTIDLYQPSKSAMNRWGVRHVEIDIVKWGDFQKSREILSQRTKYRHCRQMYAAIPENAPQPGGRTWFWQRKPKTTDPAPDPAPAPRTQPEPSPTPDVMLASNEKKSFGIRTWFSNDNGDNGDNSDDRTPVPTPAPAPIAPARPEIERTEPERSEVMLAANESSRSESRWQWLRKLVGSDDAPTMQPTELPSAPQPASPAQPVDAPTQPEVMLASVETQRTAPTAPAVAPTPKPQPAPSEPIPAPTAIIELASAPTPAPAEVKAAVPTTVSAPAPSRVVEPIAIARVGSSRSVKVSHSDAVATQRVMFAVARPDSPVPHRQREVRALPAGWRPTSTN